MVRSGKIRVAFLEGSAMIGGAEVNVLSLVQRMDHKKFETLVISPFEGPLTQKVREIGGEVIIVPRLPLISTSIFINGRKVTNLFAILSNFISFFPSSLILAKFLVHKQVDVLHTNSMLAHFYGALAARLTGVPCIWHMQDIVDPSQAFGALRRILNLTGNWLPHRIVVISEAVKRMFSGRAKNKIRVIYNGADIKKYRPDNSGETIRKEFGIKSHENVIGIVGRIVYWKGQKEFLYAAKGISEKIPNCRFLIVGDGLGDRGYLGEVKELSRKIGLQGNVVFTGFRNDVNEILAAMDIVVHASTLPEPFGLSIIEAMACGKPIVATNGGGVPEIVLDGTTGTLVPMKNAPAIERAVIEILNASKKAKSFGNAGRKRVEELFSIDCFVKNMSDQYQELVLEGRSSGSNNLLVNDKDITPRMVS
jgi:glycosyltransferase involved in cell wall biosynthesis